MSPHSNRRQDAWGGTLEKRSKFAISILEAAHQVKKEEKVPDFILGYRFSPEEIEEPGIRFEDSLFLLEKLAEIGLDYVHFSMGIYSRTSLVNTNDLEPTIEKYNKNRSNQLANVPVIGVGSILQKADAQAALDLGYDLVAVAKGFLIEPDWATKIMRGDHIPAFADSHERQSLVIPTPLWQFMDETFHLVKDKEAEAQKAKRLKSLMEKPLEYKAGEYHVMAHGHNSELPMIVTFSDSEITSIKIDSAGESAGLSDLVFEKMPSQIIDFQTLNVDAVSGASSTSQGVIDGVSEAVLQASSQDNVDVLKARQKPTIARSTEVVEETVDLVVVGGGAAGISAAELDEWLDNNGQKTPYFYHADSLEELAMSAGMDETALVNTVNRYNQFVEEGNDQDFHRESRFLQEKVGQGPYYLIEQRPRFATTMGGLVVNNKLEVENTKGNVIKGLYAAGEVVGGVMGIDSPSGANNARALTSGKLAAESLKNHI